MITRINGIIYIDGIPAAQVVQKYRDKYGLTMRVGRVQCEQEPTEPVKSEHLCVCGGLGVKLTREGWVCQGCLDKALTYHGTKARGVSM